MENTPKNPKQAAYNKLFLEYDVILLLWEGFQLILLLQTMINTL